MVVVVVMRLWEEEEAVKIAAKLRAGTKRAPYGTKVFFTMKVELKVRNEKRGFLDIRQKPYYKCQPPLFDNRVFCSIAWTE